MADDHNDFNVFGDPEDPHECEFDDLDRLKTLTT